MAFDLGAFIAGVNADTGKEQIEYISIDLIVPDPNNFYELSGINELASNIALCGLQQPIRVRRMPGDESQVIILSGHRRHAALKMLIDEGREDLRDVPCIVEEDTDESPELTQLKLIYANSSTRVLTSAEQAKQVEQVTKLLYQLKEQGYSFPGRMRDHVAEVCKISTGKIARMEVIRTKLIPELYDRYQDGSYAESPAYEMARREPEMQRLIYRAQLENKDRKPSYLTDDLAAHLAEEIEKAGKQCESMKCPDGACRCSHAEKRQKKAAKLDRWMRLQCRGCCMDCPILITCTDHCAPAKERKKTQREDQKEADRARLEKQQEAERPKVEQISKIWSRLRERAEAIGIDNEALAKACGWYTWEAETLEKSLQPDHEFTAASSLPYRSIYLSDVERLAQLSQLLQAPIAWLLGIEDTQPAGGWQTGTPTEDGRYICWTRWDGAVTGGVSQMSWEGCWKIYGNDAPEDLIVLRWIKEPEV